MSRHILSHVLLLAALASGALAPHAALAAGSYTWLVGTNGNADDPSRWSPVGVPDAGAFVEYQAPGAYTVHWNGNTPQTFRQTVWGGLVAMDLDGTHVLSELHTQLGSLMIDRGSIVGPTTFGTFMNLHKGELDLRFDASFTGGGIVGSTGIGALHVLNGAQYHAVRGLDVRADSWLWVSGVHGTTGVPARLDLPSLALQLAGTALVNSGGRLDAPAAVLLTSGGSAEHAARLQVGPGVPGTHSVLEAGSDVVLGAKLGSASLPFVGKAEMEVNDYSDARVLGTLQVGDSVSDNGCVVRVRHGGTLTLDGGLRVYTTAGAGLDLLGGLTHVRGGKFHWPASKLLLITSRVGDPELWIRNGQANDGPDSGSPLVNAIVVGRGGKGTLRLSQPGTTLPVVGGIAVGDSVQGTGTLVVDSLAALEVSGPIAAGTAGTGMVNLSHGAQVTAGLLFAGTQPGAFGDIRVTHPGTQLSAEDNIYLGGGVFGEGGMGWLTVDSLANVDLASTSFNTSTVVIYPNGQLALAHGGTLHAGALDARGLVRLDGGSFIGGSASVTATCVVSGNGVLSCNVISNGTLTPRGAASELGRLAVNGSFWQFSQGRYRVHLGSANGRQSDTLAVAVTANLGGTLALETDASFVRTVGDTFTVLTCGARNGQFEAVTWNGNPLGERAVVIYEPNAVRVVITAGSLSVGEPGAGSGLRFVATGGRHTLAFALDLPAAAEVEVGLFDVTGRRIATLAEGARAAGRYTLAVADGATLPSGVYFARAVVRADGTTSERTARATLLR